jgi:flagellar operon protein
VVAKSYGPQFQAPKQIESLQPALQPALQPKPQVGKTEFQRILEQKTSAADGSISFSAHAAKRLEQRSIDLTVDDVQRLNNAVDRAAGKGARESLVLLNDLAFVVSVPNRTVITAMDSTLMKENVVTKIDSAVIA